MIITCINQKGGVGKSTTAAAIAASLKDSDKKALLIELDAQGNNTFAFNAETKSPDIMDAIEGKASLKECIVHTEAADIIPGTPKLWTADGLLYSAGKDKTQILKRLIQPIKDEYSIIVIDTPPQLSILSYNALVASNEVIIPAKAEIFSIQGISALLDTIRTAAQENKDLNITGVLLTMYEGRTSEHKAIREELTESGLPVFNTVIRKCIDCSKAQNAQKDIYTYNRTGNAASDYTAFINELSQIIAERKE